MSSPENQLWGSRSGNLSEDQTHPIAHPIVTPPSSPLSPAESIPGPIGVPNDGAHTGTTPPSNRSTRRRTRAGDLTAIAARLSDRDRAILRSVAEHQFLTGRQIEALHFHDHAATSGPRIARRVLAKLRDLRLLGTLERRIGGIRAGSSGLIHYVDVVGDQLLRGRSGRAARRSREPSARFLDHRLAIADSRLSLLGAHRLHDVELVDCAVEPTSWRQYPGAGGARITLKPDLFAETGAGDGMVHAWFIEVDRGTESIPTLLRKCHDYESYRRTGTEQDRTGGFPIVVWSMTHVDPEKAEGRRMALRAAIDAHASLQSKLFRIIAPQQLIPLIRVGGQL